MSLWHCSANYWPAPGVVAEADSAEAAEADYRKAQGVPADKAVEVHAVERMPNGGYRRLPKPKE